MAEASSNHRKRGSLARRRQGERRRSRVTDRFRLHKASRANRSRPSSRDDSRRMQIVSELQEMMFVLRLAYCTCIVAELALQGQNADHDRDVVTTLRHNVSEPVSRQVERLSALTSRLRGRSTRI